MVGGGKELEWGGGEWGGGREKGEIEVPEGYGNERETRFGPAREHATADARRAVHADAHAGLKDWKDRDRPGPRRPRYGNDWSNRVDGKRPVPGRGAAAGEDYRAAAAGGGRGVHALGR